MTRASRPSRIVNNSGESKTQKAETPLESGAEFFDRGRGNSATGHPELPSTQAVSQAKTLFSLMGGFVPISGPFGRVAAQPEGRTHA
jgi:hypothetical protein